MICKAYATIKSYPGFTSLIEKLKAEYPAENPKPLVEITGQHFMEMLIFIISLERFSSEIQSLTKNL